VIVTYNSANDVTPLIESLRIEAGEVQLRVIVADNDSQDSTVDLLAAHNDVTVIPTGGNLGYSGGINAALQLVPCGEHALVLNPDLKVRAGAIRTMVERLHRSGAGLVAPMIVDPGGDLFPSIRREPTLLRALGDAAFGSRLKGRPASLSDIDTDPSHYCYPHPVEWASGAALLIHEDAVSRLGSWDERFFLYSEEIDFQRRARAAGFQIWFEPAAAVEHRKGGSGVSPELLALMAVNRVRYVEKYHGPVYSAAYRAAVMLHEFARSTDPAHRQALRAVADRGSWDQLPHATVRSG
jgi:GT2 family glycosyltransferase